MNDLTKNKKSGSSPARFRIAALLFLCAIILYIPEGLHANVVRLAPNFFWKTADGTTSSLEKITQSAILIIAPNTTDRLFRHQLREIRDVYATLAAAKVLAFTGLTQSSEAIPSNIPFVVIANAPQVASAYGMSNRFGIAIIGRDKNMDYISSKVIAGQRIVDIINNSFEVQESRRR